jgi:hypothetical protein
LKKVEMTAKNLTTAQVRVAHAQEQSLEQCEALTRLRKLAEQQGVQPLTVEELQALGDLWLEDESVDDFLAARAERRRREVPRSLPFLSLR